MSSRRIDNPSVGERLARQTSRSLPPQQPFNAPQQQQPLNAPPPPQQQPLNAPTTTGNLPSCIPPNDPAAAHACLDGLESFIASNPDNISVEIAARLLVLFSRLQQPSPPASNN